VREPGSRTVQKNTVEHLAINKSKSIKNDSSYQYDGNGDATLINGVLSSLDYTHNEWLGFEGTDPEAIIDLEIPTAIKEVSI
jgi:hypothetical protein